MTGPRTNAPDRIGIGFASAAAMLYGAAYVATAIALADFTPLSAALWRGVIGAAVIGLFLALPVAARLRPAGLTRAAAWRLLVLGSVGGSAFIVAMNVAVAHAGATVTAFVAGLYAVVAAVLAIPLLRERLEGATLVALLAALVGTLLLADLEPTGRSGGGVAVGLLAALCFGLFLVLSRRWSTAFGLTSPTVALASLLLSAATVALLGAALGEPALPPSPRADALGAVVFLGAGPGAVAAILVVSAMRRLPARHASAMLLLNPPTAAVAAWLLLDERLSATQLLGGAVVLLAIAAATVGRRSVPAHANGSPT